VADLDVEHTYVFVCGQHRSGTSVLARSLCSHPEVSGFSNTGAVEDEGQFLQSVYPPAFRYGGAGLFGFHLRAHLDETSPLATRENAAKLRAEWGRYWDASRSVLLEKSPPNLLHTRFLQHMFPGARFVVILRHPISVSLTTAKRGGIPLYVLLEHWLACHERFRADMAHLEHVHVLWYEDLVARPQATLDDVWRFLGLPSAPLSEPVRSHNEGYFAQWERLRRSAWGKAYLNGMCRRFEARVAPFGYSLLDPSSLDHTPLSPKKDASARISLLSRVWGGGGTVWERVNRGPLQTVRRWIRGP
jgi:hypothetical protein